MAGEPPTLPSQPVPGAAAQQHDIPLRIDGPSRASRAIVLAHGAGAGWDAPLLEACASGLAERGMKVVRFEFPYMRQRRLTGRRRGPDRLPVLQQTWLQVMRQLGDCQLVIGGKSMGGRIASLVADESQAAALVCLGYPFHPRGKPQQTRVAHLADLQTPTLIVQGTRDPLGNTDDVAGYRLSNQIGLHWLPDGDHDLRPRRSSGRSTEQNWGCAIDAIAAFVDSR